MGEAVGTGALDGSRLSARTRRLAKTAMIALGTGVLAGLALYSWNEAMHPESVVRWGNPTVALALVALAGAYVHVLSDTLRQSISAMLGASVVAVAVHLGAYVAPLWTLGYAPSARSLLLARFVGRGFSSVVFDFSVAFGCGYLLAVVVYGYFRA